MAKQLADLKAKWSGCGRVEAWPSSAAGIETSRRLFLVSHDTDHCPLSDTLRAYRLRRGHLVPAFSFRPVSDTKSRFSFTCAGSDPANPCSIQVAGVDVTVGFFVNLDTAGELPVALYPDSRGNFHLAALLSQRLKHSTHGLSNGAMQVARADRKRILLADTLSVPRVAPPIRGFNVESAAAATDPQHGPLLIAGVLTQGSFDAPNELLVKAFKLVYVGNAAKLGAPCFALRRDFGHKRLLAQSRARGSVTSPATVVRRWRAYAGKYSTACS